MARTGRFGRLPTAAEDLTSAIVNLYEAYQAQRDRNIIDSWENGGEFEGEEVTDKRLLAWFKMRKSEVPRQDPMWDYWNDQYEQTRFAIAEQKANLAYQRKDLSNGGMAAFYRQWATKVPRASAAWRDLMTSAAKFAQAAKAGSAASDAAAKQAEMVARINAIQRNAIDPAFAILSALYSYAARSGTTRIGGDTVLDLDMSLSNAATLDEELAALQNDPAMLRLVTKEIRTVLPHFDGVLTVPRVIDLLARARVGYRNAASVARTYGDKDLADDLREKGRALQHTQTRLKVIDRDLPDQYLELSEDVVADLQSASGPDEVATILEKYKGDSEHMARRYAALGDLNSAGNIRAAALAASGGDVAGKSSPWLVTETQTGPTSDLDPMTPGFARTLKFYADASHADLDLIAKGAVMVVDTVDGKEVQRFIPAESAGSFVGAAKMASREVPFAGVTYTDAKGKVVTIEGGTVTQVAKEQPVVVSVPDISTIDEGLVEGPTGADPLGVTGGPSATRKVGTRIDWGQGVISWGSPVGPQGIMLYSSIPPYNANQDGLRDFSEKDGVWTAEYDPAWAAQVSNDGSLEGLLSHIDSNEDLVVDDADPYTFDPQKLRGQPLDYIPDFDPDPSSEQPMTTLPVPGGAQTRLTRVQVLANRPDYLSEGLYGQMVNDVANGMDPASREFYDKYAPLYGAEHPDDRRSPVLALSGLRATLARDLRPPNAGPTLPGKFPDAPEGVDSNLWARMLQDVRGGMRQDSPEFRAKYEPLLGGTKEPMFGGTGVVPGSLVYVPPPPKRFDDAVRRLGEVSVEEGLNADRPSGVVAQDPAMSVLAKDAIFWSTLAAHPAYIGWVTPTLHIAARTPESRARWASKVDPIKFWKKSLERDPSLRNNPVAQQLALEQIDVLLGAGRSGIAEGEFETRRMIAAGVDPRIAQGAQTVGSYRSRQNPSMAALFGPDAVAARAEGVQLGDGVPRSGAYPTSLSGTQGVAVPGGIETGDNLPTPVPTPVPGMGDRSVVVGLKAARNGKELAPIVRARVRQVRPTPVVTAVPRPAPTIRPPRINLPDAPAPLQPTPVITAPAPPPGTGGSGLSQREQERRVRRGPVTYL